MAARLSDLSVGGILHNRRGNRVIKSRAGHDPDMGAFALVVTAVWAMLPAYLPNSAAVVLGGGPPIDGGRTLDGRRLLGDGKTWRGTVGGWAAGAALGLLLDRLQPAAADLLGVAVPGFPPAALVALPLGAMLGDMTASFLKRRSGRARGQPVPGLDQLDFVVGALLLAAIAAPDWFGAVFTVPVLLVVLVMTPLLHVTANVLAYWLDLKDEPW